MKSRIILLQSHDPGLQKIDLLQPLLRRFLQSSHLLQLLRLVSRQLEALSSLPKILGLLSDLFSQLLSTRHSQDKYSTTQYKVLEHLQQARTDSSRSRGPRQPTPQPTQPLLAAAFPTEPDRHWKHPQDFFSDPRSTYLKIQGYQQNPSEEPVDGPS